MGLTPSFTHFKSAAARDRNTYCDASPLVAHSRGPRKTAQINRELDEGLECGPDATCKDRILHEAKAEWREPRLATRRAGLTLLMVSHFSGSLTAAPSACPASCLCVCCTVTQL